MSATVPSVRRVPVLADVLPGARSRDVLLVIAGTGLTALCAQISIHVPPSPVPITGQTLAVVVAGAALGSARGGASQLLYLLIGLAVPVYADGTHGWSVIAGATGGYSSPLPEPSRHYSGGSHSSSVRPRSFRRRRGASA